MSSLRKKISLIIIMTLLFTVGSTPPLTPAETINPFASGYIDGYLLKWNLPTIDNATYLATIETYDGTVFDLTLSPQATFTIDSIPVKRADILPGMEIFGVLQGRQLVSIEAYSTMNLGYINPGSKSIQGNIVGIDRDQIKIKQGDGNLQTFYVSNSTPILNRKENVSIPSLYIGDRVKAFFDNTYTDVATRVEVQNSSILISHLYRAQLKGVNQYDDSLQLAQVEVFNNGTWQTSAQANFKLASSREAKIYSGGQEIVWPNLKYQAGKSIYLVSKNILGQEVIERGVIKNEYESIFTNTIKTINWYADTMELSNNSNIFFNDGSLIVRQGRLQDKSILNVGDSAFVVTDGRGEKREASIVYILYEELNNNNSGQYYLYCGPLALVSGDQVRLKNFFLLNNNEWESYNYEHDFFYDNDSDIYNMITQNIVANENFYSLFSGGALTGWYAYVYTDGDRIVALGLTTSLAPLMSPAQQAFSGSADNLAGSYFNLRNARSWVVANQQWMPYTVTPSPYINANNALVIKNNEVIAPGLIMPQDQLYLLRNIIPGTGGINGTLYETQIVFVR